MQTVRLGIALVVLVAATLAQAEPLAVGDALVPLTFETQHGETVEIGTTTRLVIITHDMDAGKIAKAVLAEHTGETLAARGAVYVADISKMPGFVSRFMAIPRMRRRPYPVLLDRDASTARHFPVVEGEVVVVRAVDGRITAIEEIDSEAALRGVLAAP